MAEISAGVNLIDNIDDVVDFINVAESQSPEHPASSLLLRRASMVVTGALDHSFPLVQALLKRHKL